MHLRAVIIFCGCYISGSVLLDFFLIFLNFAELSAPRTGTDAIKKKDKNVVATFVTGRLNVLIIKFFLYLQNCIALNLWLHYLPVIECCIALDSSTIDCLTMQYVQDSSCFHGYSPVRGPVLYLQ